MRFFRRKNKPYYSNPKNPLLEERINYFHQENFHTENGEVSLVKRLSWSDNNHLVSHDYYKKIVFPITENKVCFPDLIIDPLVNQDSWKNFGIYNYGGLGAGPYIGHLDGRHFKKVRFQILGFLSLKWVFAKSNPKPIHETAS